MCPDFTFYFPQTLWLIQVTWLLGEQRTEVHASAQVFPPSRGVVSHLVIRVSSRASNRQCWVILLLQTQPVPLTSSRWGGDCLWCLRCSKRVGKKSDQVSETKTTKLFSMNSLCLPRCWVPRIPSSGILQAKMLFIGRNLWILQSHSGSFVSVL